MDDILSIFSNVYKLVKEKTVATSYAEEQINLLFERLTNEYSLDKEIINAKIPVLNWGEELKKDANDRFATIDRIVKEAKERTDKIMEEHYENKKRFEKGLELLPTTVIANWKPSGYDEAMDFSNLDRIWSQIPTVMQLEDFAKNAKLKTSKSKLNFEFLTGALRASKATITGLTIVASYFIGVFCEQNFQLNKFVVFFISSIICLYTSDKWLGVLKNKIFWKLVDKIINDLWENFKIFLVEKVRFTDLAEQYLKQRGTNSR